MALSASLSAAALTIAPGDSGVCEVTVRNTGQVVDSFAIGVVGDAAEWASVEPASLNVYPGEAAQSRITFTPPKTGKTRAGTVPFGVRIVSKEDPHASRVEEGQVEVLPYDEIAAELVPHVSTGRRSARFDLAVDNRGNRPADVDLFAEDPSSALRFKLAQKVLTVEPGTTRLVRLHARPRKGFLKGDDKTLPFTVVVQPAGASAVNADGSMVQQSLLPGWLVPAVAALVALALVAVAFWFAVLKPTVKSTARAAAAQANQSLSAAVSSAASQASAAAAAGGGGAGGASASSSKGVPTPSSAASSSAVPPPPSTSAKPAPAPVAFRLQSTATAGGSDTQQPGTTIVGKPLQISDVLFQNPNGDLGTLKIMKLPGGGGPAQDLYTVGLANFRDYDYHLIQPWEFGKTDVLEIVTTCGNTAPKACSAGVTFSGLSG